MKMRMFQSRFFLPFLALQLLSVSIAENASAAASIQDIRYWRSENGIRITIDLDANARYESGRATNPDRIYFDLSNTRIGREFQASAAANGEGLLRQVRVAQNKPDTVRVVLHVAGTPDYTVSEKSNPFQITVDLFDSNGHPKPDQFIAASAGLEPDHGLNPEPQPTPVPHAEAVQFPKEDLDPLPAYTASVITTSPPTAEIEHPIPDAIRISEESAPENVELPGTLPLTIEGTLSTGYYQSFTRGGGNADQNISFAPAVAKLNINGYYLTPDLVDYSILTELNTGAQAGDAGFVGGNGVHMNISALRKRAFPLTFRYSNLQLKDAYFGSLTQMSSYTLKNRNKDLGLIAGIKLAGLPRLTLDWSSSSVHSQSYNPAIPDWVSRFSHLNMNCGDQRWGWDFQCFAGRQHQASALFTPRIEDSATSPLRQNVTQYRGSAKRSFLSDSDIYIEAGSQRTENDVLDRPINLTTQYTSVNLRMFQSKKLKASVRGSYSSNIASLLLMQWVGGLGSNGSLAPDPSVLQPFDRKTSYLNFNGLTSIDLSRGFSLYGSLDRTAVFTDRESDIDSRYFTTTAGANYSKTFGWGAFSAQYGSTLGSGSITGHTGRVWGQNYSVTVEPGNPDGLLFDITLRGTSQIVRSELPAREHSFGTEGGVGFPIFGRFRTRAAGGMQTSTFTNQGNEFRYKNYTARVGLDHPSFQLNASLNSNIGNSLQSYSPLFNGMGLDFTFLTPLRLVPSDLRSVTVTLHIIPIRRLEFSGLYTHSMQHLEGVVANNFQVIDAYATYNFRKLQFVIGYFNSSQLYSSFYTAYPETRRGRVYVRISRPIKIL